MPKNILLKLKRSFKRRGIWGTMLFAVKNPLYYYEKYRENKFDRVFGTDTSRIVPVDQFTVSTPNLVYALHYEAITQRFFYRMIKAVPVKYNDFVFIDLGSGKGRALMLASAYPFKKIIGVEFSPELHTIAKSNVKSIIEKKQIPDNFELHCMDAESFDFPKENIVLFLYNPFHGKVMLSIVNKINVFIEKCPFQMTIMYRNPKCADLLDKQDFLKLIKATPHYRVYTGIRR